MILWWRKWYEQLENVRKVCPDTALTYGSDFYVLYSKYIKQNPGLETSLCDRWYTS